MSGPKKNFIFYLDNYPALVSLPLEQRGLLITALCVYADRVWRDPSITLEEIAEQFPKMTPEAVMSLRFMAGSVLRDTQRWLETVAAREQRKREAAGQAQPKAAPPQRPPQKKQEEYAPHPYKKLDYPQEPDPVRAAPPEQVRAAFDRIRAETQRRRMEELSAAPARPTGPSAV